MGVAAAKLIKEVPSQLSPDHVSFIWPSSQIQICTRGVFDMLSLAPEERWGPRNIRERTEAPLRDPDNGLEDDMRKLKVFGMGLIHLSISRLMNTGAIIEDKGTRGFRINTDFKNFDAFGAPPAPGDELD
jgi:hypothetical protein